MIRVKVPATSANIGPGFDALGIALNLHNSFSFEEIPEGLEIIGCDDRYKNKNNLVYTSMLKTLDKIGYKVKGIKITMDTNIPVSRGLGSSAACILGGVMGANGLAGSPLSKDEILNIATEMEGHPDNIAPALYGGMVVSVMEMGKVYFDKVNVVKGMKFVALIPDFTISTKKARSVLPTAVPYDHAVYNVGRVSILISALSNGRFDLLEYAVEDRLHQPYRGKLIPYFKDIIHVSKRLGAYGTYLSGAGPTIIGIIDNDNSNYTMGIKDYFNSIGLDWEIKELKLDLTGAVIERIKCKNELS
ncbi:homoserine kinase [Tepidimicrobium xylanilyticum]